MQDFYRAFIDKIRAEAAFVAEVFPNPQKVMSLLLQSLVEFEVKPFVTRLLSRHADNSLAYVMLLEMVHRVSLEQLGGTLKYMFRDAGHTRAAEDIATILNSLFTDVVWAGSACVNEFRLPDYTTMEQENLRTLYLAKIRALDAKCARVVAAAAYSAMAVTVVVVATQDHLFSLPLLRCPQEEEERHRHPPPHFHRCHPLRQKEVVQMTTLSHQ